LLWHHDQETGFILTSAADETTCYGESGPSLPEGGSSNEVDSYWHEVPCNGIYRLDFNKEFKGVHE
jgi:hypothetical protein